MTLPNLCGVDIMILAFFTWWTATFGNYFAKSKCELTAFIGRCIIFLAGGLGTITFLSLISIV
jgi:hypothetical protein